VDTSPRRWSQVNCRSGVDQGKSCQPKTGVLTTEPCCQHTEPIPLSDYMESSCSSFQVTQLQWWWAPLYVYLLSDHKQAGLIGRLSSQDPDVWVASAWLAFLRSTSAQYTTERRCSRLLSLVHYSTVFQETPHHLLEVRASYKNRCVSGNQPPRIFPIRNTPWINIKYAFAATGTLRPRCACMFMLCQLCGCFCYITSIS